jgi:hypothetical protein
MNSTEPPEQTTQKRSLKSSLVYWVPTVLIVGLWMSGAIGSLLRSEASMEVFHRLGYPDYFATILGLAQLLGVAALLAPVPKTLREWAYAGLAFDACAATASLLATGEPISKLGFPIVALVLVLGGHRAWRNRTDLI